MIMMSPIITFPRVKELKKLSPEDFRHPFDQQNTSLLKLIPGLDYVAKNIVGGVAEQVGRPL